MLQGGGALAGGAEDVRAHLGLGRADALATGRCSSWARCRVEAEVVAFLPPCSGAQVRGSRGDGPGPKVQPRRCGTVAAPVMAADAVVVGVPRWIRRAWADTEVVVDNKDI